MKQILRSAVPSPKPRRREHDATSSYPRHPRTAHLFGQGYAGLQSLRAARASRSKYPGQTGVFQPASAKLSDRSYFEYAIDAEDGEHPLQVTVYDGDGREVYDGQVALAIGGGRGWGATSYGFRRRRDEPGIWWYVAALDNKVVVGSSLEVNR